MVAVEKVIYFRFVHERDYGKIILDPPYVYIVQRYGFIQEQLTLFEDEIEALIKALKKIKQ